MILGLDANIHPLFDSNGNTDYCSISTCILMSLYNNKYH